MACQPNARQRRANWSRSCCHIVGRLWPSALTSVIAAQIVERVDGGDVRRLPDRALGRLAIAEETVRAVVGLDAACIQGDADGGADPLAERPGGHVHEGQPRRRDALPGRIRVDAASAARPDRTRPPRPMRRTTGEPRDPSRARTDRCRGAAAPSGRNAFQRRTARQRGPPPSSSWSDVRCPPRKSTGSSRFEGASRYFSGRERAMNDQATWGSMRLQIVDFRVQIVLQIVSNSEISLQSEICNSVISA